MLLLVNKGNVNASLVWPDPISWRLMPLFVQQVRWLDWMLEMYRKLEISEWLDRLLELRWKPTELINSECIIGGAQVRNSLAEITAKNCGDACLLCMLRYNQYIYCLDDNHSSMQTSYLWAGEITEGFGFFFLISSKVSLEREMCTVNRYYVQSPPDALKLTI